MKIIVTKEILDICDKYDGDLGMLDERGASKKDREKVSWEQGVLLATYIEKLHYVTLKTISEELRSKALEKLRKMEESIDSEVVQILKKRENKKNE